MLRTDVQLYVSKDFKDLLTRGNKYENYVLEIMNLSRTIFPNTYSKVENQDNGQPDFLDDSNGDKFDAKLVVSEYQCRELCGNSNPTAFFNEISLQNNDFYDYIVDDTNGELALEKILAKQLNKESTKNKNIVFFFTFPIGSQLAQSITSFISSSYLTILFSKIKELANGRRIFGICPTLDGYYEIRELGVDTPEHILYSGLNKFYKWSVTGYSK